MSLSDDNLMKEVAEGNIRSFTTLEDKALRFCFRHLGDYQLAEDISQDGLVKLYQNAKQYKPDGKFPLFFYKILMNLCLDASKKVRYRSLASNNPGLEDLVTDNPTTHSPTQALENNEQRNLVRDAINNLPPHYRQVVMLRELEGLKYQEIAQVMNCSIDKIKVWLHRAKKQLAGTLKPQFMTKQ